MSLKAQFGDRVRSAQPIEVEVMRQLPAETRAKSYQSQPLTDLFVTEGSGITPFEKFMIKALGGEGGHGFEVTPAKAITNTAVWCSTSVRSQSIATSVLKIFQQLPTGGRKPAPKHPLWKLFTIAPNTDQSAFTFWEMMENCLCFRGNAFAQILRKGKTIIGLYPLHPDRMMLIRKSTGELTYWYSPLSGGPPAALDPSQVLHIKGKTLDGLWGISPIQACARSIGLAIAQEEYGGRFFANSARPSGVITLDGELEDEAYEKFLVRWQRMHTGANAATPAVLEAGTKWEPLSITNDEAQFIASREYQVPEIGSRIFLVPPILLGDYSDAHFANMEQAGILFARICIVPEMRRMESEMMKTLLTPEEQEVYCIAFDRTDLMMQGAFEKAQTRAIEKQWGWRSTNDIRAEDNDPPVEGGDIYYEPLNMVPLGFDRNQIYAKGQQPQQPGGVPGNQGAGTEQNKDVPQAPKEQKSASFDVQKQAFRAILYDYLGRICRKEEQFLAKNAGNEAKLEEFRSKHVDYIAETLKSPVSAICKAFDKDLPDLVLFGQHVAVTLESRSRGELSRDFGLPELLLDRILTPKEGSE